MNEQLPKNYEAQKTYAEAAQDEKFQRIEEKGGAADSGLYTKEDGTVGDLWEENLRHNENLFKIQQNIDRQKSGHQDPY